MDRMENVVTEEVKIRNALKECGYPKWSMDRVKQQMIARKKQPAKQKKDGDGPSRGLVIIPYEKIQIIKKKKKKDIAAAMRPN